MLVPKSDLSASTTGLTQDLVAQRMQERRILAELGNQPFTAKAGDDPVLFA